MTLACCRDGNPFVDFHKAILLLETCARRNSCEVGPKLPRFLPVIRLQVLAASLTLWR